MSELGEAFEGIVGLMFAGLILILMASELKSVTQINLRGWGTLYLLVAVVMGVLLVGSVIKSVFD